MQSRNVEEIIVIDVQLNMTVDKADYDILSSSDELSIILKNPNKQYSIYLNHLELPNHSLTVLGDGNIINFGKSEVILKSFTVTARNISFDDSFKAKIATITLNVYKSINQGFLHCHQLDCKVKVNQYGFENNGLVIVEGIYHQTNGSLTNRNIFRANIIKIDEHKLILNEDNASLTAIVLSAEHGSACLIKGHYDVQHAYIHSRIIKIIGKLKGSDAHFKSERSTSYAQDSENSITNFLNTSDGSILLSGKVNRCQQAQFVTNFLDVADTAEFNECNAVNFKGNHIVNLHLLATFNQVTSLDAEGCYVIINSVCRLLKTMTLRAHISMVTNNSSYINAPEITLTGKDIYHFGTLDGNVRFPEKINSLYLDEKSVVKNSEQLKVDAMVIEAHGSIKVNVTDLLANIAIETSNTTQIDVQSEKMLAKFVNIAGNHTAETMKTMAVKLVDIDTNAELIGDQFNVKSDLVSLDGRITANVRVKANGVRNRAAIGNEGKTNISASQLLVNCDESTTKTGTAKLNSKMLVQNGHVSGAKEITLSGDEVYRGDKSKLSAPITKQTLNDATLSGITEGKEAIVNANHGVYSMPAKKFLSDDTKIITVNHFIGNVNVQGKKAVVASNYDVSMLPGHSSVSEKFTVLGSQISAKNSIDTDKLEFHKNDTQNNSQTTLFIDKESAFNARCIYEDLDHAHIAGNHKLNRGFFHSSESVKVMYEALIDYIEFISFKGKTCKVEATFQQNKIPEPAIANENNNQDRQAGLYFNSDRTEIENSAKFDVRTPVTISGKEAYVAGSFTTPRLLVETEKTKLGNGCNIKEETNEAIFVSRSGKGDVDIQFGATVAAAKTVIDKVSKVTNEGTVTSKEIQINADELYIKAMGMLGKMESNLNLSVGHLWLHGMFQGKVATIKCSKTFIQLFNYGRVQLNVDKLTVNSPIYINLFGKTESKQASFTSLLSLCFGIEITGVKTDNSLLVINLLPKLPHLQFLSDLVKDINNNKLSILFSNEYSNFTLQTVISLIRVILPRFASAASAASSLYFIARQLQELVSTLVMHKKSDTKFQLVDLLPILNSIKNIVLSGAYVYNSTEMLYEDAKQSIQDTSFTAPSSTDILMGATAVLSVFMPGTVSASFVNINFLSPTMTYNVTQYSGLNISVLSPFIGVNLNQVGFAMLNYSHHLAVNQSFTARFVLEASNVTAFSYQVSADFYKQYLDTQVLAYNAVIDEPVATPHNIDATNLIIKYKSVGTKETEKDLLQLKGSYKTMHASNSVTFITNQDIHLDDSNTKIAVTKNQDKTTNKYHFEKNAKKSVSHSIIQLPVDEYEAPAQNVTYVGNSVTVTKDTTLVGKESITLVSKEKSVTIDGNIKANTINVISNDKISETGTTDSKNLLLQANNDIDSNGGSNTAVTATLVSTQGSINLKNAAKITASEFAELYTAKDVNEECKVENTTSYGAPDKNYKPVIVQGGNGESHNNVGLIVHADGAYYNIGSTATAQGDTIIDAGDVYMISPHNPFVTGIYSHTNLFGETKTTICFGERIQNAVIESTNGSIYISAFRGAIHSSSGVYLAHLKAWFTSNMAPLFTSLVVTRSSYTTYSFLGLDFEHEISMTRGMVGQKIVSPEELGLQCNNGNFLLPDTSINTKVLIPYAVNGAVIFTQSPEWHYYYNMTLSLSINVGPLKYDTNSNSVTFQNPLTDATKALSNGQRNDERTSNVVNLIEAAAGEYQAYNQHKALVDTTIGVGVTRTVTQNTWETAGPYSIVAGTCIDYSKYGISFNGIPGVFGELYLKGEHATLTVSGVTLHYKMNTSSTSLGVAYDLATQLPSASLALGMSNATGTIAAPNLLQIGKLYVKDGILKINNGIVRIDALVGNFVSVDVISQYSNSHSTAMTLAGSTQSSISASFQSSSSHEVLKAASLGIGDMSKGHIGKVRSVGGELSNNIKPDSIEKVTLPGQRSEYGFSFAFDFKNNKLLSVGATYISDQLTQGQQPGQTGIKFNVNIPYHLISMVQNELAEKHAVTPAVVTAKSHDKHAANKPHAKSKPKAVHKNEKDEISLTAKQVTDEYFQIYDTNYDTPVADDSSTTNKTNDDSTSINDQFDDKYVYGLRIKSNTNSNSDTNEIGINQRLTDEYINSEAISLNNSQSEEDKLEICVPQPDHIDEIIAPIVPDKHGKNLKVVARGDYRAPDQIFKNGFKAPGTNEDLETHINGAGYKSSPDTAYVSTSKSPKIASGFPTQTIPGIHVNYVYFIEANDDWIDVNKALGLKYDPYDFSGELEVAAKGGVPPSSIIGVRLNFRKIDDNETFVLSKLGKDFIPNPNFKAEIKPGDYIRIGTKAVSGGLIVAVAINEYDTLKDAYNLSKANDDYSPLKKEITSASVAFTGSEIASSYIYKNIAVTATSGTIMGKLAPVALRLGAGVVIGTVVFAVLKQITENAYDHPDPNAVAKDIINQTLAPLPLAFPAVVPLSKFGLFQSANSNNDSAKNYCNNMY